MRLLFSDLKMYMMYYFDTEGSRVYTLAKVKNLLNFYYQMSFRCLYIEGLKILEFFLRVRICKKKGNGYLYNNRCKLKESQIYIHITFLLRLTPRASQP